MDRNRNWQGWAALALAGLALLVALGGRGPFGFWNGNHAVSMSAPAAPQAPDAPDFGPRFGRGIGPEAAADMEREMAQAHSRMAQAHGRFDHHGPIMMGHDQRGFGFFPLFGLLRGLVNLAALGLLGFVLFTVWRQRRRPADLAGPAPTTPAGHDPRVE